MASGNATKTYRGRSLGGEGQAAADTMTPPRSLLEGVATYPGLQLHHSSIPTSQGLFLLLPRPLLAPPCQPSPTPNLRFRNSETGRWALGSLDSDLCPSQGGGGSCCPTSLERPAVQDQCTGSGSVVGVGVGSTVSKEGAGEGTLARAFQHWWHSSQGTRLWVGESGCLAQLLTSLDFGHFTFPLWTSIFPQVKI